MMAETRPIQQKLDVIFPKDKIPNYDQSFFIEETKITSLMPEGYKQRFVKEAIFDQDKNRLFSTFQVSFQHCEDHFPNFPMLPMAKLGQIMAQVGSLLIIFQSKENVQRIFPIVKQVDCIHSFIAKINGKSKLFITPGDILLIEAEYPCNDQEKVAIYVYVQGELIAEMRLVYEIMFESFFQKLYLRQQR